MYRSSLLCLLLASCAPHKVALAICPIDRVVYRQPGNPETTAGFSRQIVKSSFASDIVFWLKSGQQQFWFGFSSPNGYGGTYIAPQIDPALVKPAKDDDSTPDDRLPGDKSEQPVSMMFDAFDAQQMTFDGPPQSTDHAPARIYARELGPLFHYAHNGDLYHLSAPVRIDLQMWVLVSCDAKAH